MKFIQWLIKENLYVFLQCLPIGHQCSGFHRPIFVAQPDSNTVNSFLFENSQGKNKFQSIVKNLDPTEDWEASKKPHGASYEPDCTLQSHLR